MKNFQKRTTLALALLMAAATIPSLSGCNKEETINNEQTVNIKVYEAGYGVDWLYELETKFEEAFADEGYQVNILEPSPDYSHGVIVNEMYQGYDETGIDLYITGLDVNALGVNGTYSKVLAEDIGALVYDQPAIGFDGENEAKTVRQKVSADVIPFMTDSAGALYGFNWVQEAAGIAVNTRKLKKYYPNEEYELPRTTNELFDAIDKIYMGANGVPGSKTSGTKPVTYFSGTSGYQNCMLMTWLKQYDVDFYDTYWSMEENGEPMLADGYEVYNSPAVTDMLTNAFRFIDSTIAAKNSAGQTMEQAQAKIMKDKDGAVFYAVGGWFLNEVKRNYRDYLNDVEFMNFPVTSALGVRLFGTGTAYNFDDAKCDALLSAIIKLVDENKSIEEIAAAVATEYGTIATADLEEVAKARGVFYSRGTEHCAVITKNAIGKEVAAKFLRMMASDDFAEIFSQYANATTPYTDKANETTKYKFVKQSSQIATNRYKSLITHGATGFRKNLGLSSIFKTVSHIPSEIATLEEQELVSIYKDVYYGGGTNGKPVSVYKDAAVAWQTKEYNNVKGGWSSLLSSKGY